MRNYILPFGFTVKRNVLSLTYIIDKEELVKPIKKNDVTFMFFKKEGHLFIGANLEENNHVFLIPIELISAFFMKKENDIDNLIIEIVIFPLEEDKIVSGELIELILSEKDIAKLEGYLEALFLPTVNM